MRSPLPRIRRQVSSLVAAAVFSAATLRAQEAPATAPAPRIPQTNAIVLLVNKLAERGTISRQDASELIAQADADAADARVQIAEAQLAAAKADAALARSQAALAAANFAAGKANTAEVAATRTNAAQMAAARALLGMPAARTAQVSDDPPTAQPQSLAATAPVTAPAVVAQAPAPMPAPVPAVAVSDSSDLAPPSAALMAPADALAVEAEAARPSAVQSQVDPAENTVPSAADPQPPATTAKPAQYADGESTPSPEAPDASATASAPVQAPPGDTGSTDQSGNGAPAVRVSDVLGDTDSSRNVAPDSQAASSGAGSATRVGDTLGDSANTKPPQEEDSGTLTVPDSQTSSTSPAQDDSASNAALAPASAIQAPAAPPPQQADGSTASSTVPSGTPASETPPEDGTVSVPYVPDVVRNQIAQEVKDEVVAQAHKEGWGTTTPDWVTRISLYGDMRVRFEDIINHSTNVPGDFFNFNAINTGAPFDIGKNATTLPPEFDVDQNRQRERLRARLGAAVDLKDGFTAGFRLATGNDNNPVTENQTFGGANSAQGGDFSKYAIWLDRGYIRYQSSGDPDSGFSLTVGRFENPFLSTTMLWANDLGFDGVVLKIPFKLNGDDSDADAMKPFLVAGLFPVFNTDLNFGSNQPVKFDSYDKWLEAVQAGLKWKAGSDFTFTSAVALYYYKNIEGQLSPPVMIQTSADIGPTDDSRPSFAQNGNTYMVLRDIDTPPTAANQNNTIDQFQYFGLATPFHDLVFTQKIDFLHDAPFGVSLIGEYVKNLAFNEQEIAAKAVNNLGTPTAAAGTGPFAGGNTGWLVNLKVGEILMDKAGDWNFSVGYRRVESDSVVDAFTDADFGGILTGTNLQGFTLGASYALAHGVWLEGHWYSASAIAGAMYKNDTVQIDLNAKF